MSQEMKEKTPFEQLASSELSRLLFNIPLKVTQGNRFQPTGFPNLGAATYLVNGQLSVLVESPQSLTNRLEAQVMDEEGCPIALLSRMSYVRVMRGDQLMTTSLREPHRLNSPHLLNAAYGAERFEETLKKTLDANWLSWLFTHDVNTLIHGVFFSQVKDKHDKRLARLLSAYIEAHNATAVLSGGVKTEAVTGTGVTAEDGGGMIPFTREEFVAEKIMLYVSLDLAHLRSYRLTEPQRRLLLALALYKVRRFISEPQRLRTACDLVAMSDEVRAEGSGLLLPSLQELEGVLSGADFGGMKQLELLAAAPKQQDAQKGKAKGRGKGKAKGDSEDDSEGAEEADASQSGSED
jgi:CRISPR-associated protein Csb1